MTADGNVRGARGKRAVETGLLLVGGNVIVVRFEQIDIVFHILRRQTVIVVHGAENGLVAHGLGNAGRAHAQAEIALDGAVGKLLFVAHNKSALFDVHVDELGRA